MSRPSMNKHEITILLVEDDDIDAMSFERSIRKQKINNQIVRVVNGQEAITLMQNDLQSKPYIVLLDLNMPVMNGFEFLDYIRHDATLRKTIVFVLTSSDDEKDIVQSYDKFVAGYFVKGSTGRQFLELISLLDGYWQLVYLPPKSSA